MYKTSKGDCYFDKNPCKNFTFGCNISKHQIKPLNFCSIYSRASPKPKRRISKLFLVFELWILWTFVATQLGIKVCYIFQSRDIFAHLQRNFLLWSYNIFLYSYHDKREKSLHQFYNFVNVFNQSLFWKSVDLVPRLSKANNESADATRNGKFSRIKVLYDIVSKVTWDGANSVRILCSTPERVTLGCKGFFGQCSKTFLFISCVPNNFTHLLAKRKNLTIFYASAHNIGLHCRFMWISNEVANSNPWFPFLYVLFFFFPPFLLLCYLFHSFTFFFDLNYSHLHTKTTKKNLYENLVGR